ncbi:MAG: 50S ribosomal protein L5 [Candidatus Omnitrophica bacterium]|nr:50S ribosomal protein L5 [Candidatus Omnitrophota bacterium]
MSASNLNEQYIPRMLETYRREIIPLLKEKFGYTNTLAVPRLVKIAVNMGIGEGSQDPKIVERAAEELAQLSGQKAKICRARKPISNFKIRKGVPIGCCVTLRRYRMYEFLDRMITSAMPRIRDFRGVSANSFDGNGNYTFGLTEQTVFPEINIDKVSKTQGMNISIHTTAGTDEEARELLLAFGFPFKR